MNTPPDHEEVAERWPTAAVILAGASLFELIGACLVCGEGACEGLEAYAVSVGVVSLVLLAPIVLLLFAEPLAPPRLHEGLPHLSLMLLAWWVPAAFLLTFVAPFQRLCNGYFSALAAAASAVELSRAHVPAIDAAFRALRAAIASSTERACVCSLAATSTMMWAQAAISLAEYPKEHAATKTWAVLVGLVSMLLCGFYLLLAGLAVHRFPFATALLLWWLQGIALSFVPSAFISSMNGFVSTWASAFLAVYFLRVVRDPRDLIPIPSAPPDEEGLGGPTTTYHAAAEPVEDPTEGFSNSLGAIGMGGSERFGGAIAHDVFRHTADGPEQ